MRICDFPDCGRNAWARGLCNGHWQQQNKGQDLKPLTKRSLDPVARFWSQVRKSSGCWEWAGAPNKGGYGMICVNRTRFYAHRYSYTLSVGPIPDGMYIDHKCHNRICVNPEHLQVVDPMGNVENYAAPRANNTSGVRGVTWSKVMKKWQGQVSHAGNRCHVGYFDNLAEAAAHVLAKRNELHTNNLLDRKTA